jgi:hypothetical protein
VKFAKAGARVHFCRMLSLVVDYLRFPEIQSDKKRQPDLCLACFQSSPSLPCHGDTRL